MNKREILKQCLKNWFSDKMELQPTEENLNILVDRIYYNKQLNLSGVVWQSEQLVCGCGNKLNWISYALGYCEKCFKNVEEAN